MSIDVPKPIAAYFTADRYDAEALVRYFTEDAVVKNEGLRFFFTLKGDRIALLEIIP